MIDAHANRALATITELRADIAKLEKQFSAVEQERDALREVLAEIVNLAANKDIYFAQAIARAALEAKP